MANRKFNVGTIEEDFKRIGLLSEGKGGVAGDKMSSLPKGKKAKVVEPDDKLAGKSGGRAGKPDEKPETDEPAEEDVEDPDGEPVAEEEEATEEGAEAPEGTELTERLRLQRKRRANAKLRRVRRKQKMLRRRNKAKLRIKAKRWRKSARGRRFMKKYKSALSRFHGHLPKGKRMSLRSGMDHVCNLIEEIDEIDKATEETVSRTQYVKTFANLALIANDLAEEFGAACKASQEAAEESKAAGEPEEPDDTDFCAASQDLESVAGDAAQLAESLNASLHEGVELKLTDADIRDAYVNLMGAVQEGLELYADLTDALQEEDTEEARP